MNSETGMHQIHLRFSVDPQEAKRFCLTLQEARRHWLVKSSGWANRNMGGQKVVKSDKCTGASQLLGGTCPGCPSQSLRLWEGASLKLLAQGCRENVKKY